jgi:hypothetical protein
MDSSQFAIERVKAGASPNWRTAMAKGQMRKTKEARKPKKAKEKTNASQPTQKTGSVKGLENMRNN